MWKDIYVILFVILVSYIFTISETKKFDKQMMFILLALMIVILYKVMHYKDNGTEEGFQTINANEIQSWLSNAPAEQGAPADGASTGLLVGKANEINENLAETLAEVAKLKDILLEKEKRDENSNEDYLNSFDTRNMQTMQNKELQKLQTDIENAKVMLSQLEIAKSTKKYPKIPVYSSCVISNADGTYNLNTPNSNDAVTKDMQSQQQTVVGNGKVKGTGLVTPQSQGNEMISKMLGNILQNGVNLNFT
jgi:hypothetical protein